MSRERVIIKLSGEGLANKKKNLAIDPEVVSGIALQVKKMLKNEFQVGIIVGGGNFWRGASAEKNGIPRNRADYIGMLATLMNGLAVQSGFEKEGIITHVQSAINIDEKVAKNYVNEKAIAMLENGDVVIFAGGTGRPFFTTDTAATLIASEINAKKILMGKNGVSGVFDSDPRINSNAKQFEEITYDELLERGLTVMDSTAASMAKDNGIELIVFDITEKDSIIRASKGEIKHTRVIK
ncbi:UMP kinase [Candidatus Mycoplasma mahonii]|uniref:UMP kinase n=1 Tax=Candidatus Mycoplasma mahonii TaxID=3004105 RepID=UPI0026F37724|nr:UMP kinase [Candidatus Mycoplasma mahonii]WKX02530.1 UMP kinase [Candidatus Mycoplasma mahonii]